MSKRVTIRDVAKRANTSYQTVSRVINGKEGVAPDTMQRVLDAINELGYRPHSTMSVDWKPSQRTSIIAISFQQELEELLDSAYARDIMKGVNFIARMQNCRLLFLNSRNSAELRAMHHWLIESEAADGVIVIFHTDDAAIEVLTQEDFPVVVLGHSELAVPKVRADDENAAFVATQHLLALGHRQIGVITGPRVNKASHVRWQGFTLGLESVALDINEVSYEEGDYTFEGGYQACERLLAKAPDITGLLCFNDASALGAMNCLKAHGYQIPKDMSVMGFNNAPEAAAANPPLTTMGLFPRDFGERATQMLISLIEGQRLPEEHVIYAARLVVRQSTAAPRS